MAKKNVLYHSLTLEEGKISDSDIEALKKADVFRELKLRPPDRIVYDSCIEQEEVTCPG